MKYDIASKVVVEIGKEAILRRFLGMNPDTISLVEELSEETPNVRRSDLSLHVVLKNKKELIVLIEIQTEYNKDFVLRLIDYTVRNKLKYGLNVIPLALLLTPSPQATGFFENNILTFKYHVVRFWEENPEDYLSEIYLYPFFPLMKHGESFIEKAETGIYESTELSIEKKSDMLTAMAIFAGLKDRDLAIQLVQRRRDIMRQSVAYEIIREEGLREGIEKGIEEGRRKGIETGREEGKREGIETGREEGKREGLYDAISLGLELKYGTDGLALMEKVLKIKSIEKLEVIKEAIKIAVKIEEIEKLI